MAEVYDVNKREIRKLWEQVQKLTSHCELLGKNNNIMREKHIEYEKKITQLKQEPEVISDSEEIIMRNLIELREQVEQLKIRLEVMVGVQELIVRRFKNELFEE